MTGRASNARQKVQLKSARRRAGRIFPKSSAKFRIGTAVANMTNEVERSKSRSVNAVQNGRSQEQC